MPSEQELASNNRWLIRLRWLAAGGIVLSAAVAAGPLGYPLPLAKLVLLGVAVGAYNVVLSFAHRRLQAHAGDDRPAAQRLANTQIALDLVALAVLIHFSGGIANPFAIYLVFHMIIAGILLPPTHAYAQAGLATVLYAAVVFGEYAQVLPHVVIFTGCDSLNALDTAAHVGVMSSAFFIAAFLTITVSQKLRQREQDLAQALERVARYATSSDLARRDLQRTQEMRLQYMRKVSHELRAPLSSINMALRTIRDGLAGEVPEKVRELAVRAEARSESLLDTVGDLLTLSRVRQAPLQEPFTELVVSHLLEQVAEALGDSAELHGVELHSQIEPGLPPVSGQPEGLRTALENLLGNAIKYTPAGGRVTLSAGLEEGGRRVLVRIADTGIGVSPTDLPRLFDEFFRTEEARALQVHGSGLGLAIVKAIVTAHQGEITVDSVLGEGTVFTVQLPTAPPEGATALDLAT
ncbi:MAG: HAMP domain-containing histidine kinase [Armatimonadetes bacterium]|nr:HAMP domain-containing histidine kinase [Armatimonadota bacterium]